MLIEQSKLYMPTFLSEMGKKKAVKNMSEEIEYRCFIGGLSWSTSDRGLKDAFDKFGKLLEAKVTTPLLCLCGFYFYFLIHFACVKFCFILFTFDEYVSN